MTGTDASMSNDQISPLGCYICGKGGRDVAGPLAARQAANLAASSSGSSYDHRWLLFLIPIVLIFFALICGVWWLLRRRKKQKQRRSILRNRTLVHAELERQREREEKSLSRGNSISSRVSRMTSLRSSAKESRKHRKSGSTSAISKDTSDTSYGHSDPIDEKDEEKDKDLVDATGESNVPGWTKEPAVPEVHDADIESQGESEAAVAKASPALLLEGSNSLAASRVNFTNDAKPLRPGQIQRKELSVIGESGIAEEEHVQSPEGVNGDWKSRVTRQDSQRSITGPTSSTSHSTCTGSNPFASPTASSSGHHYIAESPTTPVGSSGDHTGANGADGATATAGSVATSAAGLGLGRRLSEVVRLRQPSPVKDRTQQYQTPAIALQRSDSRASRKSSIRSIKRKDGEFIRSTSAASSRGGLTPTESWTYSSKAAQWKASSASDLPASDSSTEKTQADGRTEENGAASDSLAVSTSGGEMPNLSLPVQLTRKTSTGVAGSRFVESFDD